MITVFAFFAAGWLIHSVFPKANLLAPTLEKWVINIALPALVLAKIPYIELGGDIAIPVASAWIVVAFASMVVLIGAKIWHWDRRTTGTLLLVTPLGNTSFLGIAAVRALLGEQHVATAVTFDQLGSFLAVAVFGSVVASRYGTAENGWRPVLKKLLTFPPFIALIISIALRISEPPSWLHDAFTDIGKTVSYTAMAALGLRFKFSYNKDLARPAVLSLATRMAVIPAIAIFVALLVGDIHNITWQATLLEISMPPMITAGVLATSSGLNDELSTFVVGTGTILSFATLPIIASILQ